MFRLGGYDPARLNWPQLEAAREAALAAGTLRRDDFGISGRVEHLLRVAGENTLHVPMSDPFDRGRAEIDARLGLRRLFRFLRAQPGLEKLRIEWMAPECGIRESFVIDGLETVTAQDYLSGRFRPDALCYSFYPIDLHKTGDDALDCRPLAEGVVPTVPAGALMVKDHPRLLAAGRIVSSDRAANSALRVQASCMATGQAAAALAVIACRDGNVPPEADLAAVKASLLRQQAIVPEKNRFSRPENP